MDSNAPYEIVRTLGSVASMISAYIAVTRSGRVLDPELQKRVLQARKAAENQPVPPELVKTLALVPPDIRDAIHKRVKRAERRIVEALNSPLNPIEVKTITDQSQYDICHALQLLKDYNGGTLPDNYSENLWKSFDCDNPSY